MSRIITVNDRMQRGHRYTLVAPEGDDFDPEFHPELRPEEMLEMGVFGGRYLRDCVGEFPSRWFDKARFAEGARDPKLNFFGVDASQPLSEWLQKGWIHPDDPRGWFQWYCRYHFGRRMEDDARQIRRWRLMRRHIAQIQKHCRPGDFACRSRQRQALLHWAYDSRRF